MLVLVDCAGHYGNYMAASVFFNVRIVNKSSAVFSPPFDAFMELRSNANLPSLVAHRHIFLSAFIFIFILFSFLAIVLSVLSFLLVIYIYYNGFNSVHFLF